MQNGNVIIFVLIGSLALADLNEGLHVDHVPETHHVVHPPPTVSYGWSGSNSGSICP